MNVNGQVRDNKPNRFVSGPRCRLYRGRRQHRCAALGICVRADTGTACSYSLLPRRIVSWPWTACKALSVGIVISVNFQNITLKLILIHSIFYKTRIDFIHFFSNVEDSSNETYTLRWASERILIADALFRLVSLPFNDVSDGILRTLAVHHLLCRIVGIINKRPRDVAEETALW